MERLKRDFRAAMASRWRRRPLCLILGDRPAPAALRNVSGTGAFVETDLRPELGSMVELRHPDAGTITACVVAIARDGLSLAFVLSERSVSFALATIAADMSRPRV